MANEVQKYLDSNGIKYLYRVIKEKLTNSFKLMFVEQKTGWGLSENNFTDDLKSKLERLVENAPSGGIPAEGTEELYVVEVSLDAQDAENIIVSITDDELTKLKEYDPCKILYLRIVGTLVYFNFSPLRSNENYAVFYLLGEDYNSIITITINLNTGECALDDNLIVDIDIVDKIDISTSTETTVPSADAVVSFIGSYLGVANGAASLDRNGKIPIDQLPSYVDDVVEGYYNIDDEKFYKNRNGQPGSYTYSDEIDGEESKIYIDLNTSTTYRFGGSVFVPIESFVNMTPLTNEEIDRIIEDLEKASE